RLRHPLEDCPHAAAHSFSRRMKSPIAVLAVFACGAIAAAAPLTVFTNGKIVTVDDAFSITDAMAVDGERIVALGGKAKALAAEHADAKRVDLGGRMVLPGLMDSHAHPVGAATMEFDHPVPDIGDIP